MGCPEGVFTKEFTAVAQRLLRGESGSVPARELEVKPAKLYERASQLERYDDDAFPGSGRLPGDQPGVQSGREDEARTAALERKIGQQAVEIDLLQQALRCVEDLRHETLVSGGGVSANLSNPRRGKARQAERAQNVPDQPAIAREPVSQAVARKRVGMSLRSARRKRPTLHTVCAFTPTGCAVSHRRV